MVSPTERHTVCRPPLLQRRRRRRSKLHRPRSKQYLPHHRRSPPRKAPNPKSLRQRLQNKRWHTSKRLHPRHRPRRCPHQSPQLRNLRNHQPRFSPRLLCPRTHESIRRSLWKNPPARDSTTPPRRPRRTLRLKRKSKISFGLGTQARSQGHGRKHG